MAKGQPPVSRLALLDAFDAGDDRFVDFVRAVYDGTLLAQIATRWAADHRPWAREQLVTYLDLPLNAVGHNILVKRLFKAFEAKGDDDAIGAFMRAFDRLIRRKERRGYRYDYAARQNVEYVSLRAPGNSLANLDNVLKRNDEQSLRWLLEYQNPSKDRLFSLRTRVYLRRRVWRYFRRAGHQRPGAYPTALAAALARYTDDDLHDGLAVLDSWGLLHACFGASDALNFKGDHARLTRPADLSAMVAPSFPELWTAPPAGPLLLELVTAARSRVVRLWAVTLLRRHHRSTLDTIDVTRLLRLIDHEDSEVQTLGAELLESSPGVARLDLATWLRLLETKNPNALAAIATAMRKHVRGDRLDLPQTVALTAAQPVPVARLGLEFLRGRRITPAEHDALSRLAAARAESMGHEIATFALSHLGTPDHYHVDRVSRFFDALIAPTRKAAWDWLTPQSPGWLDAALWSRLIETPYDDVRTRLIAALETRARGKPSDAVTRSRTNALPGLDTAALAAVWTPVLLAIHRGGRAKLTALRQIADALRANPEHAAALLPVVAVALRSVRLPEARAGLAAVVSLVDAHPELEPLVRANLPELMLEEAPA